MRTSPSLCLLLLTAAGCGSPSGGAPADRDPFNPATARAIKVTYVRFNQDPRTRRFVPEYRVMLSDGWRLRHGKSAREPFAKLFRNPFLAESIPDSVLDLLAREMIRFGLEDLRDRPMESINLQELSRVIQTPHAELAARWRIINVETDRLKRTVVYQDQMTDPELAMKFVKVEREVIKVAVQYTAQVSVEAPPMEFPGPDRR